MCADNVMQFICILFMDLSKITPCDYFMINFTVYLSSIHRYNREFKYGRAPIFILAISVLSKAQEVKRLFEAHFNPHRFERPNVTSR